MRASMYQVKSGRFTGMWHVRIYSNGRYFHIGRFKTKQEALEAMESK